MKKHDRFSRECGYACEYDDYTLLPYDPTLTDEERQKRKAQWEQKKDKVLTEIKNRKRM